MDATEAAKAKMLDETLKRHQRIRARLVVAHLWQRTDEKMEFGIFPNLLLQCRMILWTFSIVCYARSKE